MGIKDMEDVHDGRKFYWAAPVGPLVPGILGQTRGCQGGVRWERDGEFGVNYHISSEGKSICL